MLVVNFEYPIEINKAYDEKGNRVVEGHAATREFDIQEDIKMRWQSFMTAGHYSFASAAFRSSGKR